MAFHKLIFILCLLLSANLLAQTGGRNIQFLSSYEQIVSDPEDFDEPDIGGVVLDGTRMYINADFHYRFWNDHGISFISTDISQPWNVQFEHNRIGSNQAWRMQKIGDAIYFAITGDNRDGGGLRKLDISDPANPGLITGNVGASNRFGDFTKVATYIYSVSEQQRVGFPGTMNIYQDSTELTNVAEISGYGIMHGVDTDNAYLFIGSDTSGLRILDIGADPTSPQDVALLATPGVAKQLTYEDDLVYLASGDSGLTIVDVGDRANPQIVSNTLVGGRLDRLEKDGDLLITLGNDNYLRIIDVADINAPLEIANHPLDDVPIDLSVEGGIIAIAFQEYVSLYQHHPDAGPVLSFSNALIRQVCSSFSNLYQSQTITVRNTGSDDLNVSDVFASHFSIGLISDSFITVGSRSFTLQPGETLLLEVRWHYLNEPDLPDYIVFEHNGHTSPDTLRLYGCQHPPDFGRYSETTDFGTVQLGNTVTLFSALDLSNYSDFINGGYSIGDVTSEHSDLSTSASSFSMRSYSGRAAIDVTLMANVPGPFSGTIRIDHNGSYDAHIVEFTATIDGLTELETDEKPAVPGVLALSQNYPNPFNPTTTIEYALPEATEVKIDVFAIDGQQVRTLYRGAQAAGYHNVVWNGKNAAGRQVSSGMYFYRLRAGKEMFVRKMMLMR